MRADIDCLGLVLTLCKFYLCCPEGNTQLCHRFSLTLKVTFRKKALIKKNGYCSSGENWCDFFFFTVRQKKDELENFF